MGAIELNARASKDYEAKLAETQKLLIQAAAEFAPLKQASSLGAEDVVITHLINSLELDIPVFVLETGVLHAETLALLERTKAGSLVGGRPSRFPGAGGTSEREQVRHLHHQLRIRGIGEIGCLDGGIHIHLRGVCKAELRGPHGNLIGDLSLRLGR